MVRDNSSQDRKKNYLSSLLVPFCYAADLSAPAAIMGSFSPQTSGVLNSSGVPQDTAAPETFLPRSKDVFEAAAKEREASDMRNERAAVEKPARGDLRHLQEIHYYYH